MLSIALLFLNKPKESHTNYGLEENQNKTMTGIRLFQNDYCWIFQVSVPAFNYVIDCYLIDHLKI